MPVTHLEIMPNAVEVELFGPLPTGADAPLVRRLVGSAWAAGGGAGKAAVSVRVVGDAAVRRLNRQYRFKDKTTDVLSFRYEEAKGFPSMGTGAKELGDIVISLPQVRRQAKRIGRGAAAEFALMVVHGTLHLMGYDHETARQENEMFALQHAILAEAGIL